MRWMLSAIALVACTDSGGGRSDVDGPPITEAGPMEGGIMDRLPDEPPCILLDAASAALLREAGIPPVDAGDCNIGGCGGGLACCGWKGICCTPCDPICCAPPDGSGLPDAMIDAPNLER